MLSLALTLGHNSSAILIEDGKVLCGYEEERLSGIKADSNYPRLAIEQIGKYYDLSEVEVVCVSHWAPFGNVFGMSEKHFSPDHLRTVCPTAMLLSHDTSFTHHDAHMLTAKAYAGFDGHTIVADGFGNYNEVLSVYDPTGRLIHRAFGYEKSLGLLYQYATAFLGMKMNQDEYKLLGYEAHVDRVLDQAQLSVLSKHITKMTKEYTEALLNGFVKPSFDALCDEHALINIRMKIGRRLASFVREIDVESEFETRVVVAALIQSVVENVMEAIVRHFGIEDVILVGGVFYNVKVNNRILSMDQIKKISVCPLAGDQGAGLGVYQHFFGNLQFPHDLTIGKRDLSDLLVFNCERLIVSDDVDQSLSFIQWAVGHNYIVNVVRGDIEFGPRALGNTSTLMLPTMENVEYVNHLNGRNTVMPCAPICSSTDYFENADKVVNSLHHMIITLDYKRDPGEELRGAAHKYPFRDKYSGRPQLVTHNHWLFEVIEEFGLLVNTSFNKHGAPIVFTKEQILDSYRYQKNRDNEDRMFTIIVI